MKISCRDKTTASIEDIPFPDLTEVCKKFLLLLINLMFGTSRNGSLLEEFLNFRYSPRM